MVGRIFLQGMPGMARIWFLLHSVLCLLLMLTRCAGEGQAQGRMRVDLGTKPCPTKPQSRAARSAEASPGLVSQAAWQPGPRVVPPKRQGRSFPCSPPSCSLQVSLNMFPCPYSPNLLCYRFCILFWFNHFHLLSTFHLLHKSLFFFLLLFFKTWFEI